MGVDTSVVVGLLQERYGVDFLRQCLHGREAWKPFATMGQREAWGRLMEQEVNQKRYENLVGSVKKVLSEPMPELPATLYLDFARTGNRARFEKQYFLRRSRLAALTMAICMSEGRSAAGLAEAGMPPLPELLDGVINHLYAIAEETSWCLPAHNRHEGFNRDGLPHYERPGVDLFACETASVVSECVYVLEPALAGLSPNIVPHMKKEVMRRVIEVVEKYDDIGWFDGHNNWTPWCAWNTLNAAFYQLEDMERTAKLAWKLMGPVDKFVSHYGEDGGCDEGPMYWGVAGGAMLNFLELLYQRSGGKVSIYDVPKVAKMGEYIHTVHLSGPYFAAFADANAKGGGRLSTIYRYGERVGSEGMKQFAQLIYRGFDPKGPLNGKLPLVSNGGGLLYCLRDLFWVPVEEVKPIRRKPEYLPDLQVLAAQKTGSTLMLAAKAGHNAESHNHNDVGQFILLFEGEPVIVDVGRETYTAQTFSARRYELWFTRGSGHNVPMINGVEQKAGREYHATDVKCQLGENSVRFEMDLAKAYPAEAKVASVKRVITWTPEKVTVADEITAADGGAVSVEVPLFTPREVEVKGQRVNMQMERGMCQLTCSEGMKVKVERVELTDDSMQDAWGDHLNRIALVAEGRGVVRYEMSFGRGG